MIVLPMRVLPMKNRIKITSGLNGTYRRHKEHKIRQMHVSGVTANDEDERPYIFVPKINGDWCHAVSSPLVKQNNPFNKVRDLYKVLDTT